MILLGLGIRSDLFSSGFPVTTLYAPILSTIRANHFT